MRKHRLYGVVIAVLLGTSLLHPRPSSHQEQHRRHVAGTDLGRTGIRLASATVSTKSSHVGVSWPAGADPGGLGVRLASAAVSASASMTGSATPSNTRPLRPSRARFMTALISLVTYERAVTAYERADIAFQKAHTPPPPPPTRPPLPPGARTTNHVAAPTAPATRAAGGDVWAGLRRCESGGNYSDNTGNGYYGAYQFSLATWHGLGFAGLPSGASPEVQDQAAQKLQARSGWGQWPSCARRLRLT